MTCNKRDLSHMGFIMIYLHLFMYMHPNICSGKPRDIYSHMVVHTHISHEKLLIVNNTKYTTCLIWDFLEYCYVYLYLLIQSEICSATNSDIPIWLQIYITCTITNDIATSRLRHVTLFIYYNISMYILCILIYVVQSTVTFSSGCRHISPA